jgi:hypothetical protein
MIGNRGPRQKQSLQYIAAEGCLRPEDRDKLASILGNMRGSADQSLYAWYWQASEAYIQVLLDLVLGNQCVLIPELIRTPIYPPDSAGRAIFCGRRRQAHVLRAGS